jgi:hypothetical protein
MGPADAKKVVRRARGIEGWLEPEAGYLFALLDHAQRMRGAVGDIAEIGVHHGKSTVVLGSMLDRASERLIVCDLFGAQDANLSTSGRGDRETFLANMNDWFQGVSFLDVYEKPSAELTVEDVGDRCRIFHIDGGHSCEEALADLKLAARCLAPRGAIVIDDAFHAAWPGVTEAILAFLREPGSHPFVALVLGFNKLVLVRAGDEHGYRRMLDDPAIRNAYIPRTPHELKRVTLVGSELYVFFVPTYRRRPLSPSRLYRSYFQHADVIPRWASRAAGRLRAAGRA